MNGAGDCDECENQFTNGSNLNKHRKKMLSAILCIIYCRFGKKISEITMPMITVEVIMAAIIEN